MSFESQRWHISFLDISTTPVSIGNRWILHLYLQNFHILFGYNKEKYFFKDKFIFKIFITKPLWWHAYFCIPFLFVWADLLIFVQHLIAFTLYDIIFSYTIYIIDMPHKGNNKITELRTILQRESQNS